MQQLHLVSVFDPVLYSLFDKVGFPAGMHPAHGRGEAVHADADRAVRAVVQRGAAGRISGIPIFETFQGSDKSALIAGCHVMSGTLEKKSMFRVIRDNQVLCWLGVGRRSFSLETRLIRSSILKMKQSRSKKGKSAEFRFMDTKSARCVSLILRISK